MATVLTACLVVIFASAIFNAYLLWHAKDRDSAISVGLSEKGEIVEFHNLEMHPGDSLEFKIDLTHEVEGECKLSLDFIDVAPETVTNNLKNYLKVILIFNGSKVYEADLTDAIEKDLSPIVCELDDKIPVEMTVIFMMPIEVGNEAENAEAFIDLLITASNED